MSFIQPNPIYILLHFNNKGGFITLYERILSEQKLIKKQLDDINIQLKSLPTGKLICAKNGSNYKWYKSDGHKQIYIPKSQRQLAEQLATRKYLSLRAKDLRHELFAISLYLNHHQSKTETATKLLIDNPEYQNLLSSQFTPLSEELNDWSNSPYNKNSLYEEQLIHKSISGNLLRSKSEAIIDMFLYQNRIPYRYECILELGQNTIFPDFTIRHPKNGNIYYWEHFGLMDNSCYSQNMCAKLQLYTSNGIIPSINLITTYETKDCPLSTELVEKIISYYFL